MRVTRFAAALALGVWSCSNAEPPALVEGKGIRITTAELDARLAELAPPVRQAMQSPLRRRQLIDNLIQLEVLARAAEQDGLANDPAVQFALKKAMAARYHERYLERHRATQPASLADVERYFEEHRDDFSRPARVRAQVLLLTAKDGVADEARALLARILVDERESPEAFARAAKARSDDPVTRPLGGELGLLTYDELAAWGTSVADAAFGLEPGRTSAAVIASPRGLVLMRVIERLDGQTRPLDDVREQIAARLTAERADEDFERHVAKLREAAELRVADAP